MDINKRLFNLSQNDNQKDEADLPADLPKLYPL